MANTRQSTKRARQAEGRRERNQIIRSQTRTTIKHALDAIRAKNVDLVKESYAAAVRGLSKAASKGGIPKGRASRKISRLTRLLKKAMPEALTSAARK